MDGEVTLEIKWMKDWEKKYHDLIRELRELLLKEGYEQEDFEEVRSILLGALEEAKEYLAYYSTYAWAMP